MRAHVDGFKRLSSRELDQAIAQLQHKLAAARRAKTENAREKRGTHATRENDTAAAR